MSSEGGSRDTARVHSRLLVLGAGPAGYTAALYAARANLAPRLITGLNPGGQLTTTHDVENWPGEAEPVSGPLLMNRFRQQAEHFGVELVTDHIQSARLRDPVMSLLGSRATYTCDALIIATGATARYLGLASETQYLGRGVSACATCDGAFYRGQDVAVVGGGNSAVTEALYLSRIARHVTVIHRRAEFRAERVLVDQLEARRREGAVSIRWNTVVTEVLGDEKGVTGLRLGGCDASQPVILPVKGLFVAIGHKPNTSLFDGQLAMHHGYLWTQRGSATDSTATSLAGVFAAGDVQDSAYRQAVTSAATGCMAALDADRYLERLRQQTLAAA